MKLHLCLALNWQRVLPEPERLGGMTRLKKTGLLLLTAILLLCIAWVVFRQPAHRELSAAFRGWGVNPLWPDKPAILLALTNPSPAAVSLNVFAVERKTPTGWKLDEPAFVGAGLEPGEAVTLRIPVATSNAVWRIKLLCKERAVGLGGMSDRGKEKFEEVAGKTIHARFNGRVYYVTNEIRH